MKKQIIVLVCLLFPTLAFALYQLDNPGLVFNHNYPITVRLKDSGQTIMNENVKLVRSGQNVVYEVAAARTDSDQQTRTNIFYTLNDNKLTTVAETIISSKEGRPVQSIQINFDWTRMKAYYSNKDPLNNVTVSKTLNLNAKTMLTRSSSYFFQNMIANKIPQDTFTLITPTGDSYGMSATVYYTPLTIPVQGKTFQCYRVNMKADLGILAMILPDMNFYFQTEAPYEFVKYEGPQEGPTSPNIIQEVKS